MHSPTNSALPFMTVCLLCIAMVAHAQKPPDMTAEVIKQSTWRSIGPCDMGGRVADIAVDDKSPYTVFVGLATGGVIKSTNNGTTWTPVFDSEPVASIGAVAVAPSDPRVIWVGTGEANGRNSSSWGDGIYRSIDGGATWRNMGLKETQEIGRIVVDPANADVVYVAAAGHLWGPNKERGVYKTTDGGKTWQHALAIDESTGAIDVALGSGGNVYAAAYQRRRFPWGFEGSGPGSAVYRSTDSGKSWKRVTNGLPTGSLGRIGLAVARSKPSVVYALIESQAGGSTSIFSPESRYGGVFRSEDSGETWKRMSGTVPRGFYFGQIRVDPTNPDRVYVLGFELSVSDDGGKTFHNSSQGVHSDLHALWIDPTRPDRMLLGTDGGLYASFDRAKSWEIIDNFPAGEFYEVALDNREPFWAYGGLQDNGCWAGPTALDSSAGPTNCDWLMLNGGDGFYCVPDPSDPDVVYAESQGGDLERIDRKTHRRRSMMPTAAEGTPSLRFNWNSPVVVSRHDHDVVYVGGNQVIKWTKKGTEWTAISPDLSKQNGARITAGGSGAETYGTVVTLAESPVRAGLLWAGTDDGNVQLTQDGGATWTDVTGHLPGKVRDYYVKRIEPSHFDAGRAFAAIDGHRSDDMSAYLFVTEDYGRSWKSIVGDLPKDGPVLAIREDVVNPDVLFAGTEFGAYVTFDRGEHWQRLMEGLPTVAVDDLAIQPRDRSLVAATHGRSLWVVDNIAPLEDLTPKTREDPVHLFPIPRAREFLPEGFGWFGGSGRFRAANPPSGVQIAYWLKTLADEPPKIAIADSAGKSVATLSGERYPGLNRLTWDMRRGGPSSGRRRFASPGEGPRFVKPGTYTVTLTVGKEKRTQQVTISGPADLSDEAASDG